MPNTHKLTDEQEREVIALYQDSNAPLDELKKAYGLHDSNLYTILNRHNIRRRTKQQRANHPLTEERADKLATLQTAADLTVTTDANGYVQTIERVSANQKLYIWEVRFESAMRVEAESITDAINVVQRLPACRRVYGATLKGAP